MEENQKHSGTMERRRNPRINIFTPVYYLVLNSEGKGTNHGEGQILNLSQNGARLETLEPLNGVFVELMTINIDGNKVEVKGRLIYSNMQKATGYYVSGIDFTGHKDQQVTAIVAFVKTYFRRESKGEFIELSYNSEIDPELFEFDYLPPQIT
jgi:hypothetical protein